jgi:RNA polymerase sigma-70 factor (ECF subfamily)
MLVEEPDRMTESVAEAKLGNSAAWDALFHRHQLPLYSYVFELIRDEQASLDIVQETFVSAVKHIGGLREKHRFGSWLFGIAHQKVVQRWRAKSRRIEADDVELDDLPADSPGPGELLVRREDEAAIHELLARLPEPQRAVLLLHYLEDFSLEEIAGITGATLGTVKSRLHYARRALRELIEETR